VSEQLAIPAQDGSTFHQERDGARLERQHAKVFEYMRYGGWHTLEAISEATGAPQASVSARLRDLRKPRFGGHTVEREYVRRGLWRYKLVINSSELFA
jgi:hypothetical protein